MTGHRILVVGGLNEDIHLTVDGSPVDDETALITSWTVAAGGHAGNCAVALATLGASATVLGAVGADDTGDRLIDGLRAAGVAVDHVVRVPSASTGRVVIPTYPGRRSMLMHRGANDELTPDRLPDLTAFDALVVFDPSPGVTRTVMARAAALGVPAYWNPGGIQCRAAWLPATAGAAESLILNQVEFGHAFGMAPGYEPGGRELRAARESVGVPVLVVTLGADGAVVCTTNGFDHITSPDVDVVDATGAGDAFTAAYVLGDLVHRDHTAAVRSGCAAGVIAVGRYGARTVLPPFADLGVHAL